jgi:hypothetical protein
MRQPMLRPREAGLQAEDHIHRYQSRCAAVFLELPVRDRDAAATAFSVLGVAKIDIVSFFETVAEYHAHQPGLALRVDVGTPGIDGENSPPSATLCMRQGRSVTSMWPSGKKASDQGCANPPATVSTLRSPAEEGKIGAAAQAVPGGRIAESKPPAPKRSSCMSPSVPHQLSWIAAGFRHC